MAFNFILDLCNLICKVIQESELEKVRTQLQVMFPKHPKTFEGLYL